MNNSIINFHYCIFQILCWVIPVFCIFHCNSLFSQKISIEKIILVGDKKTKQRIILRELTFQKGDTLNLSNLIGILSENENRILNTHLFSEAKINVTRLDLETKSFDLEIKLRESPYIFPIPFLDPVDGFNIWWNIYDRSLRRLSYGLTLAHTNPTGNGDNLKLHFQTGFTTKYKLDYLFPFLDKSNTLRLGIGFLYSENKDVPYGFFNARYSFFRDLSKTLIDRIKIGISLSFRPLSYHKYFIGYNYYHLRIDPKIQNDLNSYFLGEYDTTGYHELILNYSWDHRDLNVNSTRGYSLVTSLLLQKSIFKNDFSQALLYFFGSKYYTLSPNTSFEQLGMIAHNLVHQKPAFYLNPIFNTEKTYYPRGFEFYNISGQSYFLLKNTLKYRVFEKHIKINRLLGTQRFYDFPLQLYVTCGYDIAYSKEKHYQNGNFFTNEFLHGTGFGLDFVPFYNKLIRVEYSINHKGTSGIFIHLKTGI